MATKLLIGLIFIFSFFISCDNKDEASQTIFDDLDILYNTKISISKANQKIVDASASQLLKDDIHIYLKGEYKSSQSLTLRNKLSISMIQNPMYTRISKLANDLHLSNGNVKADFYKNNEISSLLYADSAQISNKYNNMIAEGNVVIYSPNTNIMLLGNKVLWNNKAERIISDDNVTIIKISNGSQCIQKSRGFESDMDLSNYIFYNIKGQIGEDCF